MTYWNGIALGYLIGMLLTSAAYWLGYRLEVRKENKQWRWKGLRMMDRRKMFELLLEDGIVKVSFEYNSPGVIIPKGLTDACQIKGKEFKKEDEISVTFDYGLNMPIPIPDLEITDRGISATLSLSRELHKTFIPWNSIHSIRNEDVITLWAIRKLEAKAKAILSNQPKLKLV